MLVADPENFFEVSNSYTIPVDRPGTLPVERLHSARLVSERRRALSRQHTTRLCRSITATYREPAPYLRLGRRRRFRLLPLPSSSTSTSLRLLALDELLVAQRFCDLGWPRYRRRPFQTSTNAMNNWGREVGLETAARLPPSS